jgi:hypothetical protein
MNHDRTARDAPLDTPEGHQKLIKNQWQEFAAFAWRQYGKEGRGAVVVDLRDPRTSGTSTLVKTYYVAQGSERLSKLGGWPTDNIADALGEYDPQQEVLFLILRREAEPLFYLVSDEPPPPQA